MHKFLANTRNPINSFSSHSESHESGPNIIMKLTCENYQGNNFFYLHFRVYVCKYSDPLCSSLFKLIFWCYHVIPAAVIYGKTPCKYCMINYS